MKTCFRCSGKGWRSSSIDGTRIACRNCGGTGKVPSDREESPPPPPPAEPIKTSNYLVGDRMVEIPEDD